MTKPTSQFSLILRIYASSCFESCSPQLLENVGSRFLLLLSDASNILGFLVLCICAERSLNADGTNEQKLPTLHRCINSCFHLCSKQRRKTADGRLLLITDAIANVFGFLSLYRHVSSRRDILSVVEWTRFTPEIIAQHLLNLCRPSNQWETLNVIGGSPYIPERCLMALTKHRITCKYFGKKGRVSSTETLCLSSCSQGCEEGLSKEQEGSSISRHWLIKILLKLYFEKLTVTFDMIRNHLEPGCVDDILLHAFYFFRCGEYDSALSTCDRLEERIANCGVLVHKSGCNICRRIFLDSVAPPVDIFLDDDIHCVIGLDQLIGYTYGCKKLPLFDSLFGKRDVKASKSFEENHPPSGEKQFLHGKNAMTRAILSKYIRIRCMMETHRSIEEIMVVYKSTKWSLENGYPFDRALFLLIRRRICRLKDATRGHDSSDSRK